MPTTCSGIINGLQSLLDKHFNVEFSFSSFEGIARKGSLQFGFALGSENFYLVFEGRTKNEPGPMLDELIQLQRVMD